MKNHKAFTLIELLVVIAIIALLMSILMPALTKVKQQAQAAIDKSNQHQFALIWKYWLDDNDNKFPPRGGGEVWGQVTMGAWPFVLYDYMGQIDMRILMCPTATKPFNEGGRPPYAAWDHGDDVKIVSSYTVNYWAGSTAGVSGRDTEKFWQTPSAKGASYAPLLMDGNWKDAEPESDDPAPPTPTYWWDANRNEMRRVCVARHNYEVHASMMDISSQTIRLKRLWKTKWYRGWPLNAFPSGGWPSWMAQLPD
jgi:prepilin-type N-terminal cleavage/methylation domain-containing protein